MKNKYVNEAIEASENMMMFLTAQELAIAEWNRLSEDEKGKYCSRESYVLKFIHDVTKPHYLFKEIKEKIKNLFRKITGN